MTDGISYIIFLRRLKCQVCQCLSDTSCHLWREEHKSHPFLRYSLQSGTLSKPKHSYWEGDNRHSMTRHPPLQCSVLRGLISRKALSEHPQMPDLIVERHRCSLAWRMCIKSEGERKKSRSERGKCEWEMRECGDMFPAEVIDAFMQTEG